MAKRHLFQIGYALRQSHSRATICDDAKSKLKELYRRIHPDLFHSDEHARQTNEKSFKMLQEYISAAETDIRDQRSRAFASYDLNFFVKADGPVAERVQVTLAQPSLSSPERTRKGLNTLLKACGIEQLESRDPSISHRNMPLSLQEFIPLVSESYYDSFGDGGGIDARLRALKTALHYTHQISVQFGDDLAMARSTMYQISLLERLVKVMKECPGDLEMLRIGFGTGFTIDNNGTVWLRADADELHWIDFLHNINLDDCHEIRKNRIEIRKLAEKAAKKLGVGTIDSEKILSKEFKDFLDRILFSISADEPTRKDPITLPLVCLNVIVQEDGSEMCGKSADVKDGAIHLHARCAPDEVHDTLQSLGTRANLQAKEIRRKEDEINAMKKQVERALRLRQLQKDPGLAEHKFRAGCLRLLNHAQVLSPLLDGLSIRLTETNAFVPGKRYIDISWSFHV